MAINGVHTAIFGVDDVELCTRFFIDFGLEVDTATAEFTDFKLPEGSHVILRHKDDPSLPAPYIEGLGAREVIWGVDNAESLKEIEAELSRDRKVTRDTDGTLRTIDDYGLAIGFRVFERTLLSAQEELINSPGRSVRWNKHRQWFRQAKPQLIHHVVFGCNDLDKAINFYRNRLKFRITDIARDRGVFFRAEGRSDHHNLFWAKTGKAQFLHISLGVENIDELLAGANHMQRQGWQSKLGLGRHRISSTLYFYITSPAGGEAEYSADTDCLNDDWQPRIWEPLFGNQHWVAALPPFLEKLPDEDVKLLADERPDLAGVVR
ncbi:MAG: VOC family protein [Proteobacteria bacterium]|nr:VOC family protein [Pseudomonadota bacterium]